MQATWDQTHTHSHTKSVVLSICTGDLLNTNLTP